MAFLSPIIDNWLWKWYRGIEKILFKLILYFFFRYFLLILCISFTTCMKCMKVFMWKSWLCQESKRGRFCFEKSKEAENIFLTLCVPVPNPNKASVDESPPLGLNQRWGNLSWDGAKHDQKLIRLREAHNELPREAHKELVHQIWAQSDQQCICKSAETAQLIRGHETAEI